ncbi:MAG: hydrogenase maturation nickel metallochaperone HypA [Deferrisomatales bacterium]
MHEMGIAMEVARLAQEEARAAGASRVVGMRLRIGRWSGVEVESLRFALGAVTEGTALEGCAVEVDVVEPTFACGACGERYRGEGYLDPCPACGGYGAELIAGDELTLAEIEVDEA